MSLLLQKGANNVSARRGAAKQAFSAIGSSSRPVCSSRLSSKQQRLLQARAAAEQEQVVRAAASNGAAPAADDSSAESNWVPICRPEDLPKGTRKEFDVDGVQVIVFWYRNQLYCIEGRSPAEGAYSEGFIKAKFTQDFCIECPSTGTLFSLKDGSIVSWYPNNPVLRTLTRQDLCRNMEIYPVKLAQEAIYVDTTGARQGGIKPRLDRGGAGTSLEDNNVFTVQPTVYFEGMDPAKEAASIYADGEAKANPAALATGLLAAGIIGAAGTATFLYYEDLIALALFWVVLGGGVAFAGYNYLGLGKIKEGNKQ